MKLLEIYIDGAAKGNPGPAGCGVVICSDGQVIKNLSRYIGEATNNVAEYTALIDALQEALLLRAERLRIYTDSELLYRQLKGIYKIRHPQLAGLAQQAQRLFSGFSGVDLVHIGRQKNRGADALATKAVRQVQKKTPAAARSGPATIEPTLF